MKITNNNFDLTLLSCDSGKYFTERISKCLSEKNVKHFVKATEGVMFKNTEYKTTIKENIRGNDVYIVQCIGNPHTGRSVNDDFLILKTMIQAAYYSDSSEINVVIPYYPYSRQERKREREAITAQMAAWELENIGAKRVITIDLHSEVIEGFFRKAKVQNLHASKIIIDNIKENHKDILKELIVVSPDVGGTARAKYYAKKLNANVVIYYKERSLKGDIESYIRIGDIKGKNIILVDDMIDSGGTIIKIVNEIAKEGVKDIYIATTFGFFNGDAIKEFSELHKKGIIKKVIGTDAIYHDKSFFEKNPWYEEVSVAQLFAEVISRIHNRESVSELLD